MVRVDFAWPDRKVAVEYEGRWHGGRQHVARDRRRLNRLTAAGWTVVFVTAEDLADPVALVARCAAALAAARSPCTHCRLVVVSEAADTTTVRQPVPWDPGPAYAERAGRRGGACRTPNTSRSAVRAARSPHMPCTAGPGGVAAEAR